MAHQSPERAQLIQAYMLLHSQQTTVRRRLSVDSNSSDAPHSRSGSMSDEASPSPSTSPTASPSMTRRGSYSSQHQHRSSISSSPGRSPRRPSVPTILEEPPVSLVVRDEEKLADLSARIKTTLTDLLNCDSVKHDVRMRTWVATRLLDAEHDIKQQKRRHHSVDIGQASIIAASLRE